ncbi:DUF397 domain-containing protein [Streptomyces sioyaensis]|uniref:DUF397 domain-containing protein n=1 Tax=Streptomyces sioyaensis TaxID=67364 RepID=UPI0037B4E14B
MRVVRDSKNPHGPALLIPATAWTAFVDSLKGRSQTGRSARPGAAPGRAGSE